MPKSLSLLEKQVNYVVSAPRHFVRLLMRTRLIFIKLLLDIEKSIDLVFQRCAILFMMILKYPKMKKSILSTPEFLQKKQSDDLGRQVEYLKGRKPEYNSFVCLEDIGSGINFKRKGLQRILDSCIQGTIGEVVIAHRDRLSRFGFELIKLFVETAGGTITVIDDEQHKSSEQELSEDLMSIVQIYSCRSMGKRRYSKIKTCEIEPQ